MLFPVAFPLPSRLSRIVLLIIAGCALVCMTVVSSDAARFDCGQPGSSGEEPSASDALITLRASVGSASCELCVCDVNEDADITASDALLILRAAVGQPVLLACPDCIVNLVFLSSATYNGNLGGLAGADEKCQALAVAANLDGVFIAWLSSSTTDAIERLAGTAGRFALVDGTLVALDLADLTDGSLVAPIDVTESGVTISDEARAWTGTAASGTACFQASNGECALTEPSGGTPQRFACNSWTETLDPFGTEAVTGIASVTEEWTAEGDRDCGDLLRLVCFQRTLTP
jgi:hypothetical protein